MLFNGMIIPTLNTVTVPLQIGTFRFPMECLVEVQGGKNIVKTAVPGRDGTIKELVGFDDYTITVQCIFTDITRVQVETYMNLLIAAWQMEESLSIVCPKTDQYSIYRVVFESFSHPETKGMSNVEKLTLTFVSDDIYEFGVE